MKIELEVSEENESTESPWWMLIEPNILFEMFEAAAEHGEIPDKDRIRTAIAYSVEGPFFSRKEGEDYLKTRSYDYTQSAKVWCASGYRSHQYKEAIRAGKK